MRALKAIHLAGISALCLGGIAVGSALHLPAMAAQVYQQYLQPDTTCNSSSPCTTTTNNGSGPASANTSVGGTALTGTTKFTSTTSKFAVGVLGADESSKGTRDIGVEGTSVSGIGAKGTSKSGTGVSGVATSGFGVSGTSSNIGVFGSGTTIGVEGSGNGDGVEAIANAGAKNGTGVLAYANGTNGVGVSANGASFGLQASGATAVQAFAGASGTAVEADSNGANLFTGFNNGTIYYDVDSAGDIETNGSIFGQQGFFSVNTCCNTALNASASDYAIIAGTTNSASTSGVFDADGVGGPLYQGSTSGTTVFDVDAVGDVFISGMIYTAGGCSGGCIAHGPRQKRVVSYAPRESQPTMEDYGEGQLVDGQARVALDPAFANVIDQSANYLVFAMPEGDCNGLYIADRSRTGFVVRELHGGHSSIGFEYRIVAKPFGDHSARLPMVVMPAPPPNPVRHEMPNLKPAVRT